MSRHKILKLNCETEDFSFELAMTWNQETCAPDQSALIEQCLGVVREIVHNSEDP